RAGKRRNDYVRRWQETKWPGPTCCNRGVSARQRASAYGQRVWKWHPGGGVTGLGTSPCRIVFLRLIFGFGTGTAERSASVYGCRGHVKSVFLSAYSTMRPRYITAT